jgi:hypothetical protein
LTDEPWGFQEAMGITVSFTGKSLAHQISSR